MRLKILLSVFFLLILGIVLHVLTVRGVPGNYNDVKKAGSLVREATPFESSHERAPYAEMLAIKNFHTIKLSKELADFGSPDVGRDGARFFSFFPSGVSATIIPGWIIGSRFNIGQVSAYMTMGIFATLTMVLIFFICRDIFKLPLWASLTAPLTYAFATTAWAYDVTIYQHAAAAFFFAASFYAAYRYKQHTNRQLWWAALVWFLYGISLFFDYPNGLLLLPVMVYFLLASLKIGTLKRRKKVVRISFNSAILQTMVVFILVLGYHGYHNQHFLGKWSQIGNNLPRYVIKSPEQIRQEQIDAKKKKAAADALKQEVKDKSSGGIAKALSEDKLPLNTGILLLGIDKGLFLFSPVLLMAFLGMITLRKKPILERSILFAFVLGNIFVYSSFGDPYGGWAFGPRYLIPGMAALSIFVAIGVSGNRMKILRHLLFAMLFSISSAIAVGGALTTNLIPPKVEADFLKLKYYNFLHAFDLIQKDTSSSFVYNTYFSRQVSLLQYATIIWSVVCLSMIVIVFFLPFIVKEDQK